ncbi:hypothetical protein [Novosphingobium sp. BL-52-GroH]|uniref:hypothetical protein n=1 Tax=Novosphingobium sp. BL-52-GroH TaxID=3349877 RepID=UPI00384EDC7E
MTVKNGADLRGKENLMRSKEDICIPARFAVRAGCAGLPQGNRRALASGPGGWQKKSRPRGPALKVLGEDA